jgi:protein-S-isoprenylcysteine O-methyltransferase Ste14
MNTLGFWQGWVYLVVSVTAGAVIFAYLLRADPRLLKRRLRGLSSEKETSQKLLQVAIGIVFVGTIVLSSRDHHASWSHVPLLVAIAGDVLLVISYSTMFLAFRENTFAAVNIAVEPGQKVISTGPYAMIRHPYYSGLLLWVMATPLALGSWWALLMLVPMALILRWRIRYEERYLTEQLPGYAEYCQRVRYRLIPRVW